MRVWAIDVICLAIPIQYAWRFLYMHFKTAKLISYTNLETPCEDCGVRSFCVVLVEEECIYQESAQLEINLPKL